MGLREIWALSRNDGLTLSGRGVRKDPREVQTSVLGTLE